MMRILKNLNLVVIALVIAFTNPAFAADQDDEANPYPVLLLGIGAVIYSATLESQRKKDAYRLINNLNKSEKFKNDRVSLQLFPVQTYQKKSFEDFEDHLILERKINTSKFNLLEIKLKLR